MHSLATMFITKDAATLCYEMLTLVRLVAASAVTPKNRICLCLLIVYCTEGANRVEPRVRLLFILQ